MDPLLALPEPSAWKNEESRSPGPFKKGKTQERMIYDAEVEVIRRQTGDLEEIRLKLGLSARKISQLLMVDPSAWTRWTRGVTPTPPHIFRALQWYLLLQEKSPAFTPQLFLSNRWHSLKETETNKTVDQLTIDLKVLQWQLDEVLAQDSRRKAKETSPKDGTKWGSWIRRGVPIGIALLLGFLFGRFRL